MSQKRNATAFEVATFDELTKAQPGAFMFYDGSDAPGGIDKPGLVHNCPCGCGALGSLWFEGSGRQVTWTVSGEWPKATLSPSIGFHGKSDSPKGADGFHWHGYLRNGVFEEC